VRYFLLPLKRRTTYYLLTRLDLEVVIPELRGDIRTGDRLIMLAAPETLPYQPWATVATVRGRDAEDPTRQARSGHGLSGSIAIFAASAQISKHSAPAEHHHRGITSSTECHSPDEGCIRRHRGLRRPKRLLARGPPHD